MNYQYLNFKAKRHVNFSSVYPLNLVMGSQNPSKRVKKTSQAPIQNFNQHSTIQKTPLISLRRKRKGKRELFEIKIRFFFNLARDPSRSLSLFPSANEENHCRHHKDWPSIFAKMKQNGGWVFLIFFCYRDYNFTGSRQPALNNVSTMIYSRYFQKNSPLKMCTVRNFCIEKLMFPLY